MLRRDTGVQSERGLFIHLRGETTSSSKSSTLSNFFSAGNSAQVEVPSISAGFTSNSTGLASPSIGTGSYVCTSGKCSSAPPSGADLAVYGFAFAFLRLYRKFSR
jgi:hypothetical protein